MRNEIHVARQYLRLSGITDEWVTPKLKMSRIMADFLLTARAVKKHADGVYSKCELCATRWLADEDLPCPKCSA